MFGGRRDQKGEAAAAHAIGMHGIVMLFVTQTTCGYLCKRKRIAQNHCHYTETQSELASVLEQRLHTLETNYVVSNTKYYSYERQELCITSGITSLLTKIIPYDRAKLGHT